MSDKVDTLRDMPYFPSACFENLPGLLKTGCDVFQSDRERDVFLLSALTLVSGCIPDVSGGYDGRLMQANLFAFIVAPPASGKGVMLWSRWMGTALNKHRQTISKAAKNDYFARRKEAEARGESFDEPEPPDQTLFLPANASATAFMQGLLDNGENAVVIESEADVLSGALKQDWGDYSYLLRQAFHHETASNLRKGHRIDIQRPALSVALSGTKGQAINLIKSPENGLFSRFMFYVFSTSPIWRDVSPQSNRPVLDDIFDTLALTTKQLALSTEQLGNIRYDLEQSQWVIFNENCRHWLSEVVDNWKVSEEISSSVFRLGLIVYRISMVLTVIRRYEENTLAQQIRCSDTDFKTAFVLGETLFAHAKAMFDLLPRETNTTGNRQGQFLDNLSNQSDRTHADTIGLKIGIKPRSVTNYLRELTTSGRLTKTEHGHYQKST